VRAVLRLTAYQLLFLDRVPRWAAVDEAVSIARLKSRNPGPAEFVNAVLRAFTRAPSPPRLPADPVEAAGIRWSFPDWMAARWIARYGPEEAERLMAALNERPPMTIRANTLRISRDDLAARLREEELAETEPTRLAPEGLTVRRGAVGRWAAFASGWCAIQDEASMLIGRLLDPQPGELVADTCAAPGTKTTHLAQLMGNRGRIIAMDPHAGRLGLLTQAVGRLGVSIVEAHAGGVASVSGRWKGRCDRVLVDAPCSNLGVLRRNPDVKWKREEAELGRLAEKQRGILAASAALVRPGGRLVYATCSLLPEENERQVESFLAASPDFRLVPIDRVWAEAAAQVSLGALPSPPPYLKLTPARHGTDGFFAAVMERQAAPAQEADDAPGASNAGARS
jgi:16S rRNA (cytosine967-C5)-methyltransferase